MTKIGAISDHWHPCAKWNIIIYVFQNTHFRAHLNKHGISTIQKVSENACNHTRRIIQNQLAVFNSRIRLRDQYKRFPR